MSKTCYKILNCGHPCCGVVNEVECLPCLDPTCVEKDKKNKLRNRSDNYCEICSTVCLA